MGVVDDSVDDGDDVAGDPSDQHASGKLRGVQVYLATGTDSHGGGPGPSVLVHVGAHDLGGDSVAG